MMHSLERLSSLVHSVLAMVVQLAPWMLWNLMLAVIPLYLASRLFRHPDQQRVRSVSWIAGTVVFTFFLPNAPYVLTDLIHLFDFHSTGWSAWQMAFIAIPLYVAMCVIGFGSYVVSLIWLTRFLAVRGWAAGRLLAVEMAFHFAAAVGIYLGRFIRFNTWDILRRPGTVATTTGQLLVDQSALFTIGVFFLATVALYYPARHIIIALVVYVRSGGFRRANALAEQYM